MSKTLSKKVINQITINETYGVNIYATLGEEIKFVEFDIFRKYWQPVMSSLYFGHNCVSLLVAEILATNFENDFFILRAVYILPDGELIRFSEGGGSKYKDNIFKFLFTLVTHKTRRFTEKERIKWMEMLSSLNAAKQHERTLKVTYTDIITLHNVDAIREDIVYEQLIKKVDKV